MQSFFDNIICISLKDREDRKKNILESFPFNINFFEAFNTKNENILLFRDFVSKKSWNQLLLTNRTGKRNYHHNLTNGSIGCFLSHIQILRYIVDNDIPLCLVFEDDNEPRIANIKQYLSYLYKNFPSDCDILFLDYFTIRYNSENSIIVNKEFIRPLNRPTFKLFLTNCLIISNQGARKILENFDKVSIQYDAFLCKLFRDEKINIYISKNKYFRQSNKFMTDIQSGDITFPKKFDYNKI